MSRPWNESIMRHAKALAKETNTTVEVVHSVTQHFAENIAKSAIRAEGRAPSGDWLEVAMACNAAPNKHARFLIEYKARQAFDRLRTPTPPVG